MRTSIMLWRKRAGCNAATAAMHQEGSLRGLEIKVGVSTSQILL